MLFFIALTPTLIDPMPGMVRGLITSHGTLDRKVIAILEDGCVLLRRGGRNRHFAQEFAQPRATFLRSDKIVVIDGSRQRGRVYALKDGNDVFQVADFTFAGEPPIAIIATDYLDQFATVTSKGLVTVFQVPEK